VDDDVTVLRAAVFDLFGTLVPEFSRAEFEAALREAATMLACEPEAFLAGWGRTTVERQQGDFADVEENVRAILDMLGRPQPDRASMTRALARRTEMYREGFYPRPGAVEMLEQLRRKGIPTGLISICTPDIPALWRLSPMASLVDVALFSSEVGIRKPDPRVYLMCCERLGVDPTDCLYCGDGSYGELSGASRVGMTVFQIRDPEVDAAGQLRPEGDDWSGAWIADLRELMPLFEPNP
jgi:putative hydrolase of the HAD superfamily